MLIDLQAHEVRIGGEPVRCPPVQYELLVALPATPARRSTASELLRTVWGAAPGDVHPRRLRIAVSVLRGILGIGAARPRVESVPTRRLPARHARAERSLGHVAAVVGGDQAIADVRFGDDPRTRRPEPRRLRSWLIAPRRPSGAAEVDVAGGHLGELLMGEDPALVAHQRGEQAELAR